MTKQQMIDTVETIKAKLPKSIPKTEPEKKDKPTATKTGHWVLFDEKS